MKFPKITKFRKNGYAKCYSPTGTRIYKVLDKQSSVGWVKLLRVGTYRLDGYKPSKGGNPFWVDPNYEYLCGPYVPCKLEL